MNSRIGERSSIETNSNQNDALTIIMMHVSRNIAPIDVSGVMTTVKTPR